MTKRKLDNRAIEVISIAQDCVAFVEKMANMGIPQRNQKELALVKLNQVIIEARLILKGKGEITEANTAHLRYTNLGI